MKVLAYRVSRKFEGCGLTTLHIDALDCQLQKNQMRIVNVDPFKIIYDNNGIVRNYTDRVNVSVHNFATKTITFDTMSVLSIAHYTESQLDVPDPFSRAFPDPEEHLAAIDMDLDKVDKLNQYVSSYLNQLESDMLFEDIEAMHKQQAIDYALANRDTNLFYQLVRGEVRHV